MLGNPRQSWIPGCGFRLPGTGFGFLVSGTWIPDSLSWITDSKAEGSGFQRQNFSRIPESRWPYRALLCISGISSLRKNTNITDSLYFHKKLTWRINYRLIVFNAVTHTLQLVGWYIFWLMLFDGEKVLGFFEIQFVGSPRSPPLTSSLRSVLSLKSLPQLFNPRPPYSMLRYRTITRTNTHSCIQHWASGEGNKKKGGIKSSSLPNTIDDYCVPLYTFDYLVIHIWQETIISRLTEIQKLVAIVYC